MRSRWGVLISGNGSTLQSFLDCQDFCDVVVVIASKSNSYGILRARRQGLTVEILPLDLQSKTRKLDAEKWIAEKLKKYRVEKVFLAGFMRIVSSELIEKFKGEIYNIHPSLLPSHKGLDALGEALRAGDENAGVTIHHVAVDVDSGENISQRQFDIPAHRDLELTQLWLHIHEQKLIRDSLRRMTWQNQRMS